MADGKRYYWLRLHDDFFDSKRIKKLRRMAGGDTYTIIYLKMQLLAMKTEGVLRWTGLEDNIADELALDLDEESDNVKVTLGYLLQCGLAETSDNISFFFPYAIANTGSETSSAARVREFRERQKALQCNTDVTPMKQICNGKKEIEKEKKERVREDVEVDCTDTGNRMNTLGGSLGQGVLMLTEDQMNQLLTNLSMDEFDCYTKKLSDYIIAHPDYTIKSHYNTIMKWVEEDRRRNG